jgi:hypothetical protein
MLRTILIPPRSHRHQWRYSPDRALASFTGFMIVIVWCGLSAPRSTWFYTPWFSHQRHLVVTTRDSSGEAGKHGWENGHWILPTSTYRARMVLLHTVNLRHGTDGFTSLPKEGVLRILSPLKSIVLCRPPRYMVLLTLIGFFMNVIQITANRYKS